MEATTEYKEYTYTSEVNGRTIIVRGTVYATDRADATYQAKKETALSGYKEKEIKINFKEVN